LLAGTFVGKDFNYGLYELSRPSLGLGQILAGSGHQAHSWIGVEIQGCQSWARLVKFLWLARPIQSESALNHRD
jgi:hypothetical protein